MANRKKSKQILGVMVTGRAVHAALLNAGPEGLQVLRRFTRPRTARGGNNTAALPELSSPDDPTDFSVQFTDNSGGLENMFLGSEFGGLESPGFDLDGPKDETAANFTLELGDILAEIRDAGLPEPTLAFCAAASEINQVELHVLGKGGGDSEKKRKRPAKASRSALLELLAQQHKNDFAEECVSFLPMVPADDGQPRYLAVFPKANDPVASTIRMMREQQGRRMPSIRLMDTEVALYMGLTRAALGLKEQPPAETEGPHYTLIVRAGAEDTLVLFLEDGVLRQSENLRSLTAYEAPETICSRVLLLQDEYGISDVQHVLLLSEEREDDLVESFEMFFPDARVESMRQYVPELDDEATGEVSAGALLPAVGVALRLVDDDRYHKVFEDVNLLPKQLLRRRINIPVTWHVLALYVFLFCTVLFFMARYFTFESRIADIQDRIRAAEADAPSAEVDARVLQGRIDSLQQVHSRYMTSINVLEGLLMGSDRWSRALEKSSREVSKVTGIWIESWSPREHAIELTGNATTRDQVVLLADRLGGQISTLTFSEIREWPVYSFTMTMNLDNGLPEAARYLREQVAEAERQAAEQIPIAPTASQ